MRKAMQHLEAQRLAALDHDSPSTDELAHLVVCASCRAERDAFVALSALAEQTADVSRHIAPLTSWETLSVRLRSEGLLTSAAAATLTAAAQPNAQQPTASASNTPLAIAPPMRRAAVSVGYGRTMLRVAAGVVLVLGGAFGGRLSGAERVLPSALGTATDAGTATTIASAPDGRGPGFWSIGQATDALDRAQREYERASLWLAANDTTVRGSDVYRARLAALDQMMAASRAGLRDAPQDPLLSQYYRAAYAAREATLQQLGSALPVDKTLEGY